jgi:hypothetical protein
MLVAGECLVSLARITNFSYHSGLAAFSCPIIYALSCGAKWGINKGAEQEFCSLFKVICVPPDIAGTGIPIKN